MSVSVLTTRRITGAEHQYSITFKVSTGEKKEVNFSRQTIPAFNPFCIQIYNKMTIFMLFAGKTNHCKCVCGVSWHFNTLRYQQNERKGMKYSAGIGITLLLKTLKTFLLSQLLALIRNRINVQYLRAKIAVQIEEPL